MALLTINHKKITLAAVIITAAFILIIMKAIRREQPERGEAPTLGEDGHYSYRRHGRPQTEHFTASEFDCKNGTPIPQQYYGNVQFLMQQLEVIRAALGVPLHINSGYRSPAHNATLNGSAKDSQHLYAKAADITAVPFSALTVYRKILELIAAGKIHNGGLGLYNGFVHYDVRTRLGRWNYSRWKV